MTAPWWEGEGIDDDTFWGNVRDDAGDAQPTYRGLRGDGGRADWFVLTRAQANAVACRDCQQPIGLSCIDVGSSPPRTLVRFPAHPHRINDAGAAT